MAFKLVISPSKQQQKTVSNSVHINHKWKAMIIRAVSDGEESDGEIQGNGVFSGAPSGLDASSSACHSTKQLWIALCGAIVLLLLVDLSSVASQLFPQQQVPFGVATDSFCGLAVVLQLVRGNFSSAAVLAPSASVVNNAVGLVLLCAWIYSRESRLARHHRRASSSASAPSWLASGPCVVLCVLAFGHVVSCVYVLVALFESNGDRSKFWLGKTATSSRASSWRQQRTLDKL